MEESNVEFYLADEDYITHDMMLKCAHMLSDVNLSIEDEDLLTNLKNITVNATLVNSNHAFHHCIDLYHIGDMQQDWIDWDAVIDGTFDNQIEVGNEVFYY